MTTPLQDTGLDTIEILSGLDDAQQRALSEKLTPLQLRRGDQLVRQGEEADALFVVISGRFAVTLANKKGQVAEIGPGQPIGEIAFLSGGVRTATVTAMRDSLVLRLSRDAFNTLARDDPGIWRALAVTLARRVAETTSAADAPPDPQPRTIVLVRAGTSALDMDFAARFAACLGRSSKVRIIRSADLSDLGIDPGELESSSATRALNNVEAGHDFILYIADSELTAWSEKALRHADLVLAAGKHGEDASPNALEQRAAEITAREARRLVLLHKVRGRISGTRRWLAGRNVAMHHHVALATDEDIERLCRFVCGTARGLVACGGGALCPTHVGIYKALTEKGFGFDIMGGTSAGSAMVAAFMLRTEPEEIIASIHDMFVKHKAMRRYTLPRYSLLDHTNFDAQLRRYFGGIDIEDLWLPYFAVSTNLSRYTLHPHRSGDLWTAVRASASIPVLLPPVYTPDGEMLVDGGLLDNVPIRLMHELKSGPNVVVSFLLPEMERFDVDYGNLPARMELVMKSLAPGRMGALPAAPGLITVLMRSLMANRQDYQRHLGSDDMLLVPPIPKDISFLDWHRHRELYESGYLWAKAELAKRTAHP